MAEKKEMQFDNWDDYVKHEVGILLNSFLPISSGGGIEIKYAYPKKEEYEGYTEYDKTQAEGVTISLMLEFDKVVKLVN